MNQSLTVSGAERSHRSPTAGASCPSCQALRARLRETEEELAAWAEVEALDHSDAEAVTRVSRWMEAFSLSAGNALLLMIFVDRPGRVWNRPALLRQLRNAPCSQGEEVSDRAIDTRLKKIRKAMKRECGKAVLKANYGLGWLIDAGGAAALKARVGEGVTA